MLYYLFKYLNEIGTPGVGVFEYISFRALAAIVVSLLISLVFGGRLIQQLQKLQVGEIVRDLGLEGQKAKQGTPTMGGIIIITAILIPCLLFCKLDNIYVILMITATVWMGAIGFIDDYIKVFKKDKEGLQGRFKILGQIGLGLLVGLVMFLSDEVVVRVDVEDLKNNNYEVISYKKLPPDCEGIDSSLVANVKTTMTNVPFLKDNEFDYANILPFIGDNNRQLFGWIFFILAVIFIVTAVSNAANLTDGIDGLAAGTSAIIGGALGILIYVSRDRKSVV